MKLYPNAKFIVAMRDYRAIVLSHKESIATALVLANRKKKDKLSSSIINAYKWNMYNREVLRLQKLYPDKLLVVSYENMVQQTETTVRQACQFWGIPFLPSMLSPHQRLTPQTPTESTDQREIYLVFHATSGLAALMSSSTGLWRLARNDRVRR